jgi:Ca2+-transporting ATPase
VHSAEAYTNATLSAAVPWHSEPIEAVLARIGPPPGGLSAAEAERRRLTYGFNRLPPPPRASALAILLQQFSSIVVWLLVAATAISLLLGDAVEAAAIASVLAINTAIGFVMEWRARRAMEAVVLLDVPRATVIRGGHLRIVHAQELVPGDLIELTAGRRVPADARLVYGADLRVNEAALTGESLPVSKHPLVTLAPDAPLAERSNMVYGGTIVAAGIGRAVVTATGVATATGRIGDLVRDLTVEPTVLERRLDALGGRLVWLALGVAALVVGLGAAQGASAGLLLQTAIALAVAAVPEALPVVATIALAIGMKRMAARHALVRRLASVESLGSTTVICTDKTRTLTSGDMTVVRTWTTATARELLEAAALASAPPPAIRDGDHGAAVDPVDAAVLTAARGAGIDDRRLRAAYPLAGLVPFSSDRKLMAAFHQTNGAIVASVKGAPLYVLKRCRLDDALRRTLIEINDDLARSGLRVLGVAAGEVSEASESALTELSFIGFIGLADPPAPDVGETIARLRHAGLRTIMLTGDQSLTAQAVGRELGVIHGDERVVEGREIDTMTEAELREVVADAGVFGRITPEHKLRIVAALQARGEIVAMLGDGVNDAPALRKADVGVAMGTRGTDAARHAAAVVLQDDRFETIAAAVEEGRAIFDNIQKVVLYLFSCNLAEILVLLAAGAVGLPLPLLPLQLLWLNMITDTFPALALAVEPADGDVMHRPPRSPDDAILSARFLVSISLYGALITASTMAAFAWGLATDPARATTMAFMTLALAQTGHLGNARSARPVLAPSRALANRYALAAVALAVTLQMMTVLVAPVARLLHVTPLGGGEWMVVLALAAVPAALGQAIKTRRPHL